MKYLFSILAILYVSTQICNAKNISSLHVVFVSNMVNPNEHQIDELTNLIRLPLYHVLSEGSSLMSDIGLAEKYSIIFSSQPDEITTLPVADIDNYTGRYFRQLVKNRTANANSIAAASLNGLRTALEISSKPSVIVLATNTKPTDTHLLAGILDAMVNKTNPVVVLHIDSKWRTSIYNNITTSMKYTVEKLTRTIFHQNTTFDQEYVAIMQTSKTLLLNLGIQAISEKYNLLMSYNPSYVETLVFVYEVFKIADKEYLRNVSDSMESDVDIYFNQLKPHSRNESYSVVFPTNESTTNTIRGFANYTSKDFQDMIGSQKANFPTESSLQSLLRTLQTIPTSSWIVYYVDSDPKDSHEVLLEIVQLITDKRIKITLRPVGGSSLPGNGLVYRTIRDAGRMARSSSPRTITWTLWITSLIIFVDLVIVKLV